MTRRAFAPLKKIALEAGVLFPIANVFTFAQTDNRLAVVFALLNVVFSVVAVFRPIPYASPLRITAFMVLLSGLASFASGDVLPGIAGLVFATGAAFSGSEKLMAALRHPATAPMQKLFTHPAIYFGIGYIITGLMAGGGIGLLAQPLLHLTALIMIVFGSVSIVVASFGLALGKLEAAIPFWIQATGTGINALAGLVVGNFVGMASCAFSMFGTLRLGWLTRETSETDNQRTHHGL